jgi:hypothetical protein
MTMPPRSCSGLRRPVSNPVAHGSCFRCVGSVDLVQQKPAPDEQEGKQFGQRLSLAADGPTRRECSPRAQPSGAGVHSSTVTPSTPASSRACARSAVAGHIPRLTLAAPAWRTKRETHVSRLLVPRAAVADGSPASRKWVPQVRPARATAPTPTPTQSCARRVAGLAPRTGDLSSAGLPLPTQPTGGSRMPICLPGRIVPRGVEIVAPGGIGVSIPGIARDRGGFAIGWFGHELDGRTSPCRRTRRPRPATLTA